MDPKPTATRRQFIATTTAAAAAFTIVPRHVLGGPALRRPERQGERRDHRRRRAGPAQLARPLPGGGLPDHRARRSGRGMGSLEVVLRRQVGPRAGEGGVEKHYADKTPNLKCSVYEDFRVMLEKEKAIDAVLIATPDHLHAYVSILAMKAGKHVYCEKPLTHNIREARLVARVAKETGVATQMGNSGPLGRRASPDGRVAQRRRHRRRARSARLERQPADRRAGPGRARVRPTKPAGLNWDLWLGPRAERPYSGKLAPFVWRWVWDFGNGTMPDMAPHHFDPAFNALGLDAPVTVEARASFVDAEVITGSNLVTYQYAARGDRGPLTVYWYDNGLRPPTPLGVDPDDPLQRLGEGDNGLMLVGEKGILTCAGWSGMPRLLPLELHRAYKRPPRPSPASPGIMPTGCRPARAAHPRAATSSTARGSPSSSSSARWRSGRARW